MSDSMSAREMDAAVCARQFIELPIFFLSGRFYKAFANMGDRMGIVLQDLHFGSVTLERSKRIKTLMSLAFSDPLIIAPSYQSPARSIAYVKELISKTSDTDVVLQLEEILAELDKVEGGKSGPKAPGPQDRRPK